MKKKWNSKTGFMVILALILFVFTILIFLKIDLELLLHFVDDFFLLSSFFFVFLEIFIEIDFQAIVCSATCATDIL